MVHDIEGPPASELLERVPHLTALRAALVAVARGPGGVLVLISGEAGGGKTVLLRRFCAEAQPSPMPDETGGP